MIEFLIKCHDACQSNSSLSSFRQETSRYDFYCGANDNILMQKNLEQ